MTKTRFPDQHRGAHLVCAALLLLPIACAHGAGPGVKEKTVSVIVQAPDMQHAVRAVALAGGTVTHELGIIRSVGATVTPAQLELLAKVRNFRIRDNRAGSLSDERETGTPGAAEVMVEAAVAKTRVPHE